MNDMIELTCHHCRKPFIRRKPYTTLNKNRKNQKYDFCSLKCQHLEYSTKQTVACGSCGTIMTRIPSHIKKSKSGKVFCNHSCAALYTNTHKTTGNRRSKLEIYLEEQIELNYPELGCIYNSKEIINSELDFYFPTLKFAIELNGILHYEPIYGDDRLEKIQNNDMQKQILCYEQGIELCIIDSSSCKYLNQKQKDKYWSMINIIIQKIQKRHQC